MAASWPTTIATDSTLYVAVNELQNNLSGAINSAVTTIGLNSTTGFPTVGLILIDNEVIKYTGISVNNLTGCTRAFDGTTAASHSSAAVVSFAFCAAHHNNLKDEVIAVETSLNFTASKAISSDVNGRLAVATTTLAELNFVSGVTSAIQTQLNAKAPTASPTFSGTITTALTANRALTTGAAGVLAVSATTDTEVGYLSGVTSAIQTQINAKRATFSNGQLPGTATNDSASAGNVGEYVSSAVTAVNVGPTTQVNDLTSISLTAGDWDVTLIAGMNGVGAFSSFQAGISTTSGNSQAGLSDADTSITNTLSTAFPNRDYLVIPAVRMSFASTTTVYAKQGCTYSGSTPSGRGRLSARRVR